MPNVKNYREQGGERWVVGGSLDVATGGDLDIESGGALKIAGTAVTSTAAELNILDTVTATAAQLNHLSGVTAGTAAASKAVVLGASSEIATVGAITTNGILGLSAAGGLVCANGLLMGWGTTANPATTAVANKNMVEFRTESTATSGISRGLYNALYLNGAGVSGEALRGRTVVDAAVATLYGASSGVEFGASGSVTGLVCGHRANILIPDRAMGAGGTYFGHQAEIYIEGDSSDISPVTKHAVLSVQVAGPGNAAAQDKVLNMIAFDHGGTDGSGKAIYTHTSTPGDAAGSIRVLINGTLRHIHFWANE